MNGPESRRWLERSARVIPGAIYGHTSPVLSVPGAYPAFAREGRGARYVDVDGQEYIDLMCGYGPVVLGHGDEEVDAAFRNAKSGCLNHPSTETVELAERLVDWVDFAAWAVMAKNGSDLTTWCIRVAREHTGRPVVLKARDAYHGMHAWCSPGGGGVIPEDRARIHEFTWNDVEELERAFRRNRGRTAALILTPFHHPAYGDSELPTPDFVQRVNELCRESGALLVLDDVRCGLRLAELGSHGVFGYEPDLAVYGKALANGHTISAAVGRAEVRAAASRVFLTGTFWNDPAPMAAALATLDRVRRDAVPERLAQAGERLLRGIDQHAQTHQVELTATGPPAMPYIRIAGDDSFRRTQAFCVAALAHGVFIHPHHNWFLCAAHTDDEIDEAVRRLGGAFEDFVVSDPLR